MIPQDPLAFLYSLEQLGMKFGLENISRLCAALGNPHQAFRSVIVGGTNGKGSVTAMVDTGLRAAGHRTARYTSPHLVRLEERFVIDGQEVTTSTLRDAAAQVQKAVERLLADGTLTALPTFFECTTAAAFVLFRDAGVELAVLEVGLGGRLDSTNIVTPIAAAITSIDFDHQAQLGNTIESIAFEKAGIIKAGIPVVLGELPAAAEEVIERVCAERHAIAIHARDVVRAEVAGVTPSLKGAHQRQNIAVAVALLDVLDRGGIRVPPDAVRAAVADTIWPGRLEYRKAGEADVLLDAAHNPAGARALASYLREIGWTNVALVFAAMRDKDVRGIIEPLVPFCSTIICTAPRTPRATPPGELADIVAGVAAGHAQVTVESSPHAALARASWLNRRVVVAGSIFLIGPLRDILR